MCLKAAKKKIISTSVSLLYVHHCVTTGDPSACKYSACPRNTPTAEWEAHTSIYLMRRLTSLVRNSHLRGSSHPQCVALSAYSAVKRMQCGLPRWLFYGNKPIHQTYHIRNHNCFSESPQRMNIHSVWIFTVGGGRFERRSNWFSLMQMSHYQMRLTLEVLSERLFVPSFFAAHLIDRHVFFLFFFQKNLPQGMQCALLMSYLLGPALVRLELC